MNATPRTLRRPDERVGTIANVALPPPADEAVHQEELLVRALRLRDEAAFTELLDRYYAPMLRLAARYVRTREEAEEVVQDTWLAVLRGLDAFEGRSSLRTWIFRILVNRARTRARRSARTVPFSALGAGDGDEAPVTPDSVIASRDGAEPWPWPSSAASNPDPAGAADADALHEAIARAIETLPPRQREVITLRDLEGWKAAEVCEKLDISEANQRVLLHRARLRVRESLGSLVDNA